MSSLILSPQTYGDGLDQSDSPALVGIERSAISFVHSQVRGLFSDIGYNSGYTTGRTTHAYLQQYHVNHSLAYYLTDRLIQSFRRMASALRMQLPMLHGRITNW